MHLRYLRILLVFLCFAFYGSVCNAQLDKRIVGVVQSQHTYVDLGLPSGTLWATCNIGANSPEEYGDYFAWGETKGYNRDKDFNEFTYRWYSDPSHDLTKYCTERIYGYNGFTDDKTELDLEDDAAYVNWGSGWRMPSYEQYQELINSNYTTAKWTTQNGVKGRKITSNANGNSIFLPAAGYRHHDLLRNAGSNGYYWSRMLDTINPDNARSLGFDWSSIVTRYDTRYCGQSVRPVRSLE